MSPSTSYKITILQFDTISPQRHSLPFRAIKIAIRHCTRLRYLSLLPGHLQDGCPGKL